MTTITTAHTSADDVRDQLVLPALGEHARFFDVDAIVADVITGWDDKGHALVVDDDTFWKIVERHAR